MTNEKSVVPTATVGLLAEVRFKNFASKIQKQRIE